MIQTPSLSSLSSHPAPCVWSCSHEDADWCQSWFSNKSMSPNTQMMFLIPLTRLLSVVVGGIPGFSVSYWKKCLPGHQVSASVMLSFIHFYGHYILESKPNCPVWSVTATLCNSYMYITISSQTIFTFHPSKHENYRLTFLFTRTFSIFCLSYNSIKIKIATNYPVTIIIVTLWQC